MTSVPPTLSLYCEFGMPWSRSCPGTSATLSLARFPCLSFYLLPVLYHVLFSDLGPRVSLTRLPLEPALLFRKRFLWYQVGERQLRSHVVALVPAHCGYTPPTQLSAFSLPSNAGNLAG